MRFIRILRIFFIFVIIYLILGLFFDLYLLIYADFVMISDLIGNLIIICTWPFFFFVMLGGQYGEYINLIMPSFLITIGFFIWFSYYLEKKLFSKRESPNLN